MKKEREKLETKIMHGQMDEVIEQMIRDYTKWKWEEERCKGTKNITKPFDTGNINVFYCLSERLMYNFFYKKLAHWSEESSHKKNYIYHK